MAEQKHRGQMQEQEVNLIRILGMDIRGDKRLFAGLTQIKGISWAFANATCKILGMDKNKRIQELSKEEIQKLENFVKNPEVLSFLKNRRHDLESGEDRHVHGEDIKLRREFDIKRLKKIKAYKGLRHNANLPVRGQRTKGNFRRNRQKSVASAKKKKKK